MSPVVFSLIYLVSWLLMGLGVFLTFRLVAHLRQGVLVKAKVEGVEKGMPTRVTPLLTLGLVALVVLASLGVFYAGAYTFYNLILVP